VLGRLWRRDAELAVAPDVNRCFHASQGLHFLASRFTRVNRKAVRWTANPTMHRLQIAIFITAGIIWIIGGNVLAFLHARRVGQPKRLFVAPFPLRDFNVTERLAFVMLLASALALGIAALRFS
jgi:hypothetical protein